MMVVSNIAYPSKWMCDSCYKLYDIPKIMEYKPEENVVAITPEGEEINVEVGISIRVFPESPCCNYAYLVPIDAEIAEDIQKLNLYGARTCYSCAGHENMQGTNGENTFPHIIFEDNISKAVYNQIYRAARELSDFKSSGVTINVKHKRLSVNYIYRKSSDIRAIMDKRGYESIHKRTLKKFHEFVTMLTTPST